MSIWKYSDTIETDFLGDGLLCHAPCRYCGAGMNSFELADQWPQPDASYLDLHQRRMLDGDLSFDHINGLQDDPEGWHLESGSPIEMYVQAANCPACGWWRVEKQVTLDAPNQPWDMYFRAAGALRSLDLSDVCLQLNEIRAFLTARYESRFHVHPRKYEEVVGSVFGNLGYDAIVTTYSRDGGIDVVLHGQDDELIGVQVKRTKNRIKVEQIRSFVGALLLGGFVKGIFVTTSRYQSGVSALVRQAAETCIPIELIDESVFFEALGVAQIVGTDPASDVLAMLQSDARPELHCVAEFHRNSL